MPGIGDKIHDIATIDGGKVYLAGSGGQAVDSAEAFAGLDGSCSLALLVVIILPAAHLPQPDAVDPADLLGGGRAGAARWA